MAAEVLWEQWAPDIPNAERIHDLLEEGRDLLDNGQRVEACEQWLNAWEFIKAVTPDEIMSLAEAERYLPVVYSVETTLRNLEAELATAAADDPTHYEQRIEFYRGLYNRFPESNREFLLDCRYAIAESCAELGREPDRHTEFEAIIEAYPDDPWVYLKLGDSYWRDAPAEATSDAPLMSLVLFGLSR